MFSSVFLLLFYGSMTTSKADTDQTRNRCILPPFPSNGSYEVLSQPSAAPGEAFDAVHLKVHCDTGLKITKNVDLFCIQGVWSDEMPKCIMCGISSPAESLILDGSFALRGKVPWQAGIYRKERNDGYMQICGGSLVTEKFVISAAHCFHNRETTGVLPPSNFVVTLGKIYRNLNDSTDTDAQISDVEDIKVPPRFTGLTTNYQADIALVKLVSTIRYNRLISPICLDFNINFENHQLRDGNLGMFAGWDVSSPILNIRELPYVDIARCIADTPINSRELITSDKICAGGNATAGACRGNAGGGLAFPKISRGVTRFYLRGILSTAPAFNAICDIKNYAFFTEVSKYEQFIKEFITFHL